jgi:CBS domain containing-hemolysin-like protein
VDAASGWSVLTVLVCLALSGFFPSAERALVSSPKTDTKLVAHAIFFSG